MAKQPSTGVLEEFRIEFLDCWQRLPNKGFFLTLLACWLALFCFLGNSTLGYARTSSLLVWMYQSYVPIGLKISEADEAYALLVPPAVLVLFWTKRKELLSLDLRVWAPGLLLVLAGLGLHMLGYLVQQPRLSVLGLFTGIYGFMGLAWGPEWLRRGFFPFCLFVFCVPLGSLAEIITFPLRLLVTRSVELVCHYVLAIDIIRQGNNLIDPTGHYQYEVAAACSGIRSLIATFALAVVLAFLSFRQWWKRLVMVASAFPLATLGNLIRMMAIVIAAEIGGQEWGNAVHEGGPGGVFSLLPYVPGFIGLLVLEHYLRGKTPPRAAQPAKLEPVSEVAGKGQL